MKKTERELMTKVIEALILLYPTSILGAIASDALNGISEDEELLFEQIDDIEKAREILVDLISSYTGVTDNDFVGDGYLRLSDSALSGDHSPSEALEMFENVDLASQREWIVRCNLDYLDECNEKIRNNIGMPESRNIFDGRFKLLLEQTGVKENKKMQYQIY